VGWRRIKGLVEQVLPIAGKFFTGDQAGGTDGSGTAIADQQDLVSDIQLRRPSYFDGHQPPGLSGFDHSETRGMIINDTGSRHGLAVGPNHFNGFCFENQVADGQDVAPGVNDHAAAFPLGPPKELAVLS